MKKIIVLLVCCLISISYLPASSLKDALSLDDAIALYEDDQQEWEGERIIDAIKTLFSTDINATDDEGMTALILASLYGYTEIVELLRVAGATE